MLPLSKSAVFAVAFPLAASVFTVACDRPAAPPVVTEEPSASTMVASSELGKTTSNDGYREAVRREQRELDARIQESLEAVDRKLGTRPTERAQLLGTRQRLAADQRLIAKSDERGWDELKAEVERDVHQAE